MHVHVLFVCVVLVLLVYEYAGFTVYFLYVILDLFFEVKLVVVHSSQICLLQFIRRYIYCMVIRTPPIDLLLAW